MPEFGRRKGRKVLPQSPLLTENRQTNRQIATFSAPC
jgi:hypothetical protein